MDVYPKTLSPQMANEIKVLIFFLSNLEKDKKIIFVTRKVFERYFYHPLSLKLVKTATSLFSYYN